MVTSPTFRAIFFRHTQPSTPKGPRIVQNDRFNLECTLTKDCHAAATLSELCHRPDLRDTLVRALATLDQLDALPASGPDHAAAAA